MAARVCGAKTRAMLFQARRDVDCDPGVERTIAAAQNVHEPVFHKYLLQHVTSCIRDTYFKPAIRIFYLQNLTAKHFIEVNVSTSKETHMTKMKRMLTATIAGLMGATLSKGALRADTTTPAAGGSTSNASATDNNIAGDKHGCKGVNACAGKGGCKANANGCAGKNACKGKGGCATAKHDCKGKNDCKGQGKGGNNSCKGQGACNTNKVKAATKKKAHKDSNACKGANGCK
jgi:hypothetical protein